MTKSVTVEVQRKTLSESKEISRDRPQVRASDNHKSKEIVRVVTSMLPVPLRKLVSWTYQSILFDIDKGKIKRVAVDAGKSDTPSLHPSTFVNNQYERNDHMVLPATNLLNQIEHHRYSHKEYKNSSNRKPHRHTMQSFERCERSIEVMQMTQSVAWFASWSNLLQQLYLSGRICRPLNKK